MSEALPAMQDLASRCWSPNGFRHPGQLAWSVGYALPEDLGHGPVRLWYDGDEVAAYAWLEEPTWAEVCVHPSERWCPRWPRGWPRPRTATSRR